MRVLKIRARHTSHDPDQSSLRDQAWLPVSAKLPVAMLVVISKKTVASSS
jgi:hypothetical protein